ncbi:hypothetical protein CEXT_494521 [Caerostris extrusa]|uniref:Uncharacterized protein n=1 Tax=Caerostris extrusa TaxID=172846 RepID=A0AAV4VXH0_CAEEX|nr:hypothetical protein CEXT_494521 [Caerostris extrusa]
MGSRSVETICGRASSRWYFADPRLGSDSRNRRSKSPILSLLQIPEKVKLQQVIQTSSSLQEDQEKCNKMIQNIESKLTAHQVSFPLDHWWPIFLFLLSTSLAILVSPVSNPAWPVRDNLSLRGTM